MRSYKITYEKDLGWVLELTQSDLDDGRQAIVLEDHEAVNEFLLEFDAAYRNELPPDLFF